MNSTQQASALAGLTDDGDRLAVALVLAVSLMLAVSLALLFTPEFLNTDTAQYLTGARQLLAGHGYSTNLLYFEDQLYLGVMPSPQTVWPPGYSLLLSTLMLAGVPDLYAPFWLGVTCDLLTPIALFLLLREIGVGRWVAFGTAILSITVALPHLFVLRGLTESTFTLLTVLALWSVARAYRPGARTAAWLLGAGAFAAAAFLVRYAGITLVAALGLWFGLKWLVRRTWADFRSLLFLMAVPTIVVAGMFLRNWLLVGNFTGGPDIAAGASWGDVVRNTLWSMRELFGLGDTASTGQWLMEAVVLCAALFLGVLWFRVLRRGSWPADQSHAAQRQTVIVVSLLYGAATFAMFMLLAHRRFAELIAPRYLAPLMPVLLMFAASALRRILATDPATAGRTSRVVGAALAVLLTCFVLLQVLSAQRVMAWLEGDPKFKAIAAALDQKYNDTTVRDYLLDRTGGNHAMLDIDGQLLGLMLDRPAVGLSEATWTSRTWDEAEVLKLVRTYHISVVCLFPTIFDPEAPVNSHRIFYRDLAHGNVPDWLVPAVETPLIKVYEVRLR